MSVLVLGSLNMDLVVNAPRLPRDGETLTGTGFFTSTGGKGANQAVAAARLGARTKMIGRVGADAFGEQLVNSLANKGVDVTGVNVDDEAPTGVALISIGASGENSIVVIPGANGRVGDRELEIVERSLPEAQVLLLQLEIPLEAVCAAAEMAHRRGTTVILDPAPAAPVPDALLEHSTWITPNKTEAEALVGFSLEGEAEVGRAARVLEEKVAHVVITLGERGLRYSGDVRSLELEPFPVAAVDSVAAGDAFNGALAVSVAEGRSVEEALRWASAAGALAATRHGAQSSLPSRGELETFLGAAS